MGAPALGSPGLPPPIQINKESIESLDITNIDQFINATTASSQLDFIKKLTINYQKNKSELELSYVKFMIQTFLESPLKHPLKLTSSKILISLKTSVENIEELTYKQLLNNLYYVQYKDPKAVNDLCSAVGSCIDIFPNYAEETFEIEIFNFLTSALELNITTLENEFNQLSPTKKSDIYLYIHNTFRLQMLTLQKYNLNLHNIESNLDKLKYLCLLLLKYEDVPMDTKINCCTTFVLILRQYDYDSWISLVMDMFSIKSEKRFLLDENHLKLFQKDCVQLGIFNAIVNITDPQHLCQNNIGTMCALEFITRKLLTIGEKSSVNTVIILGVSRALLIISKLLLDISSVVAKLVADLILTYLWSFLNHFIDTVRHLCIQILNNIVKLSSNLNKSGCNYLSQKILMTAFSTAKNDHYLYYVLLRALGLEFSCSYLLSQNPKLIDDMLSDINNSSDLSIVSSTFEVLMTKHLKEGLSKTVFDTWVVPILDKIILWESNTQIEQSVVVTIMREILHNAVKLGPDIAELMMATLLKLGGEKTLSDGQFKCTLICLNVAKKNGYFDKFKDSVDEPQTLWKGVIPYDLLNSGIHHQSIEINLQTFSLIVDSHKTTELFNYKDFDIVMNFFKYNININIANFKQEILSVTKKLFSRWEKSYQKLNKNPSDLQKTFNHKLTADEMLNLHTKIKSSYEKFIDNIYKMCLDNIFPNANFSRKNISMQVIIWCHDLALKVPLNFETYQKPRHIQQLYNYLDDSYECNKQLAVKILSYPSIYQDLYSDDKKWTSDYEKAITKASSIKPTDCLSSAYKLELLLIKANKIPYQLHYEMMTKLLKNLRQESHLASNNILEASANGPMYGLVFCIAHVYNLINWSRVPEDQNPKWMSLIQDIIKICFDINKIVAPIVNNSSPEGHLPMDFSLDVIQVNGNNLELENGIIVSAQMVLLCGWRSVKEVSLLLGDIVSKSEIIDDMIVKENEHKVGMVSKEQILEIGDHFMTLLSETKHRGAFEKAYVGFTKLCSRLWKCQSEELHNLPKVWLKDMMTVICSNVVTSKLCSTRRSAGVPFIIQALVITELQVNSNTQNFKDCMHSLLDMAKNQKCTVVTRTHSLNILRSLYRHTALGEHINPYVSEGLIISIKGFEGTTWAERNSSTLLFSSLMTRIFGVTRTKDTEQLSIKNKMTGRIFFMRYPKLYDFFLAYLKEVVGESEVKRKDNDLYPSLYPILLLLSRLYPSSLEGTDSNLQLEAFVPYLIACSKSPVLKIRQLAAKAILPIVNSESYANHLSQNLQLLCNRNNKNTNFKHGIFLQIIKLLSNLSKRTIENTPNIDACVTPFFEQYDYFLNNAITGSAPCYINAEAYLHVLLLIAVKFPKILQKDEQFYLRIRDKLHEIFPMHKNSILYGVDQYYTTSLHLNFKLAMIFSKESFESLVEFYLNHPSHEVISLMLNYLICFYNQTNADQCDSFEIGHLELNFVQQLGTVDVVNLLEKLNETEWYKERILTLSKQSNDYEYKDKALRLLFYIPNAANDYIGICTEMNEDEFFDAMEKYEFYNQHECYLFLNSIDRYLNENRSLSNVNIEKLSEILLQNCTIETDESNRLIVAKIIINHWKLFEWRNGRIEEERFLVSVLQWSIVFKLLIDESKVVSSKMSKLSYEISKDSKRKFQTNENKSKEIILNTWTEWLYEKSLKHTIVMLILLAMGDNSDNVEENEIRVFEKEETDDIEEECHLTELCIEQLKMILTTDNLSDLIGEESNYNAETFKCKIGAIIESICKFKSTWNLDPLLKSLYNIRDSKQLDQITNYKMRLIIEFIDELSKNIV